MTNFTTAVDDTSSSGDFIGQSDTSGDGSYVLVKIPNHGSDDFYYKSGASVTMTSFLRIGAVPSDDPTAEHGWDLAKLVVGFIDDTRRRDIDTDTAGTTIASIVEASSGASIATDLQTRMKSFYGSGSATSDQTKRINESKKLHYRGGWRDHSDGNRISTTLGDKVEIIRGNYKMVVLGRQPSVTDPVDSLSNSVTTWDASGGHIMDWRATPGAFTEISWVLKTDATKGYNTWKVTEETVKGDVEETFHGNVTETFLGPSVTSTTGWEGGGGTDSGVRAADDSTNTSIPKIYRDYPTLNRENPIVTEKTWAKKIYDYVGSSDCKVEYIKELTYADEIHEEVRVTTGAAKITSEIHAGEVIEDVYVDYHSSTYHGVDKRELWMGHFGELFLGAFESFKIGNFLEGRLGVKILGINTALTTVTTINAALSGIDNIEVAGTKTDILFCLTKGEFIKASEVWSVCPAPQTDVTLSYKRMALAIFLG